MAGPEKPGRLHRRGPALRRSVMVDAYRGTPRIRAWPRKRGSALNPKTKEQMDWFAQANRMTKYLTPTELKTAMDVTAGTPLMPRDLLLMAMSGRIWSITIPGRGRIYPMAARDDVSASLDAIGQTPGDILARALDGWIALNPGAVGYVLTSTGPGGTPAWVEPLFARPAPQVQGTIFGNIVGSTTMHATRGRWVEVLAPVILQGITAILFGTGDLAETSAQVALVDQTGPFGQVTEILATTPIQPSLGPNVRSTTYPLSPPITLQPGNIYLLAVNLRGQGPTAMMPIIFSEQLWNVIHLPNRPHHGTPSYSTELLTVGATPDNIGNRDYGLFPYA